MYWLEWDIGLRYTMVGRGDRFVSFSSIASAIGIMLGIASVIVVMSVMNGFHTSLRDKLLSTTSHVEVILNQDTYQDWPLVIQALKANPQIIGAAPQLTRQGLASHNSVVHGVIIKGIDPAIEESVTDFATVENLDSLQSGKFNVLVGTKLAARLNVKAGSDMVLIAPTGTATIGGLLPRFKKLNVTGTAAIGVHHFDNAYAYMHHEDVAKIFKAAGVETIRLRLKDVFQAPKVAEQIAAENGLASRDWSNSNATLFNALAVERRVMFIILSLIIAVAAFQIVAALVTMVRSKRGDIAILRTMGMSPTSISRIFLIQGMLIGLVGTIAGVALGLIIAPNVSAIVLFVEQIFGVDFFPGEVYYLEQLPSEVHYGDVFTVAVLALGLSLLATIFPSLNAARINPADALRYE